MRGRLLSIGIVCLTGLGLAVGQEVDLGSETRPFQVRSVYLECAETPEILAKLDELLARRSGCDMSEVEIRLGDIETFLNATPLCKTTAPAVTAEPVKEGVQLLEGASLDAPTDSYLLDRGVPRASWSSLHPVKAAFLWGAVGAVAGAIIHHQWHDDGGDSIRRYVIRRGGDTVIVNEPGCFPPGHCK